MAKSISRTANVPLARLNNARVIRTLIDMLQNGQEYPLLLNEAIIAITIITTFELSCASQTNLDWLLTTKDVLHATMPTLREGAQSVEVQANSVTMLRALGGKSRDTKALIGTSLLEVEDGLCASANELLQEWKD
jgi:hypothetical protein